MIDPLSPASGGGPRIADARRRQVQTHLVRKRLLALRADVDRQLSTLAEGLILPDEIRQLPKAAAQVVAVAEPLWAGVDLDGPVTYELTETEDREGAS